MLRRRSPVGAPGRRSAGTNCGTHPLQVTQMRAPTGERLPFSLETGRGWRLKSVRHGRKPPPDARRIFRATRPGSETGIPKLDPQTGDSGVQVVGPERLGKQAFECGLDHAGAVTETEDLGVGTELVEDLTAGTAGCGRRLGWRVDQGGPDPQRAGGSGDRLKNGGTLGTDGQTVRGILDVATGEDVAAIGQYGRADGELAVGAIGAASRFTGRDEQRRSFPVVNHGGTGPYPRHATSGGIRTSIVRAGKLLDAEPSTELSKRLAVLPLRLETLENRNQHGHDLIVGYVVLEFEVEPVADRSSAQEDRVGSGPGLAVGSDVGRAADQTDVGVIGTGTAIGAAGHPYGQAFLGESQPGELGFEVVEDRGQGTFRLGDSQSASGQGGAGHRPAADCRDSLDRGDAVLFQPGVDLRTPGGVKVGQED